MQTIVHRTMIVTVLAGILVTTAFSLPQDVTSVGKSGQSPAETLDTLSTSCLDLVVNSNGNFGNNSAGTVNMDYFGPTDCDTGLNSRGNSRVYLGEGSPIIIRRLTSTTYVASWSIYGDNRFVRAPGGNPESAFSTSSYNAYTTGTLLTADSSVKVELTWYAPTHADSCNFVVQKMLVFPATISSPVANLQIGQAFDFDIPTDSGTANNVSGSDAARRMVWLRGFNSTDTVTDCVDNGRRYGGAALLNWYMKSRTCLDSLWSGSAEASDMLRDPLGHLIPDSVSKTMHIAGYGVRPAITDQIGLLTYRDGMAGYTLPANDTLTIITAIATVRTAASAYAGLDSLKKAIDKAKMFNWKTLHQCGGCCVGKRGNVNCVGIVDLSDLSAFVSYLTGGGFVLCCLEEADMNGNGVIDLWDISCLISMLTGGWCAPADCPMW